MIDSNSNFLGMLCLLKQDFLSTVEHLNTCNPINNPAVAPFWVWYLTPSQTLWPSIAAEVRAAEFPNHLHADAQWWWSNSGYQTTAVVLFSVYLSLCPCPFRSMGHEHAPFQRTRPDGALEDLLSLASYNCSHLPPIHPTVLDLRCKWDFLILPTRSLITSGLRPSL